MDASGCSWMHIHTLGTRSARKHSHTAYGCVSILIFYDAKWLNQHMDVAYEWMVVHSYRNDMYQIGKLHTYWTHGTDIIRIKEVN